MGVNARTSRRRSTAQAKGSFPAHHAPERHPLDPSQEAEREPQEQSETWFLSPDALVTRSERVRALLHTLTTRRYARFPRGTAIIGRGKDGCWQIVWCPNSTAEPVTLITEDAPHFPHGDAESIVCWLGRQPWAKSGPAN